MTAQKRTLLIIEDDQELSRDYKLFCKMALRELAAEGLVIESIDNAVKQAYTYAEAAAILRDSSIDFISVDLALGEGEKRQTEAERTEQGDPGGMVLLKELQRNEKRPISVIVSGEKLQSYAIDAYRQYGVLAFYQKDTLDPEQYKSAIKVAILSLEVMQLIASPQTELDIETAEKRWQRILEMSNSAGIVAQPFFGDVQSKFKTARSERTHPATGLPGGRWTEERLKDNILGRDDGILIRVMLKGFGKFLATYGSQEEAILVYVASLLKRARANFPDQKLFIGHLGYHEHGPDPSFIIIPEEQNISHSLKLAQWIETEFKQQGGAKAFMSIEKGRQEPKKKFKIEARVLTGKEADFSYLDQLLDTLKSPQLPGGIS